MSNYYRIHKDRLEGMGGVIRGKLEETEKYGPQTMIDKVRGMGVGVDLPPADEVVYNFGVENTRCITGYNTHRQVYLGMALGNHYGTEIMPTLDFIVKALSFRPGDQRFGGGKIMLWDGETQTILRDAPIPVIPEPVNTMYWHDFPIEPIELKTGKLYALTACAYEESRSDVYPHIHANDVLTIKNLTRVNAKAVRRVWGNEGQYPSNEQTSDLIYTTPVDMVVGDSLTDEPPLEHKISTSDMNLMMVEYKRLSGGTGMNTLRDFINWLQVQSIS